LPPASRPSATSSWPRCRSSRAASRKRRERRAVSNFIARTRDDLVAGLQIAEDLDDILVGGAALHIHPLGAGVAHSDDEYPLGGHDDGGSRYDEGLTARMRGPAHFGIHPGLESAVGVQDV